MGVKPLFLSASEALSSQWSEDSRSKAVDKFRSPILGHEATSRAGLARELAAQGFTIR